MDVLVLVPPPPNAGLSWVSTPKGLPQILKANPNRFLACKNCIFLLTRVLTDKMYALPNYSANLHP